MKGKMKLLVVVAIIVTMGVGFYQTYSHLPDILKQPGEVNWSTKAVIHVVNAFHPGYSSCARCGRNWGWTTYVVHKTTTGGIFLFCSDCDKVVTPEERWKALDEWKVYCINTLHSKYPQQIMETEYIEWPRGNTTIELVGGNYDWTIMPCYPEWPLRH